MLRSIQLAAKGLGNVSPNPMVGAVIASPDGRIIGEGFHRRCGEAHAEVNAVNSVADNDRHLLSLSTIYVTLEPCCHYGKTPPCADLLISQNFKKVVIGTADPFEQVSGHGIARLRQSGIDVTVGVEEEKCRSLNARFMTAHSLKRPFITLKWAQSADGYMDYTRNPGEKAAQFSDLRGLAMVHRLRATHDAIAVGSGTALKDRPSLDVRYWIGNNPQKIVFDRSGSLGEPSAEIEEILKRIYREGVTSILIEGGPTILKYMIDNELWDLARIEVSPSRLGKSGIAKSPPICSAPIACHKIGSNQIYYYSNNPLVNTFFIENAL